MSENLKKKNDDNLSDKNTSKSNPIKTDNIIVPVLCNKIGSFSFEQLFSTIRGYNFDCKGLIMKLFPYFLENEIVNDEKMNYCCLLKSSQLLVFLKNENLDEEDLNYIFKYHIYCIFNASFYEKMYCNIDEYFEIKDKNKKIIIFPIGILSEDIPSKQKIFVMFDGLNNFRYISLTYQSIKEDNTINYSNFNYENVFGKFGIVQGNLDDYRIIVIINDKIHNLNNELEISAFDKKNDSKITDDNTKFTIVISININCTLKYENVDYDSNFIFIIRLFKDYLSIKIFQLKNYVNIIDDHFVVDYQKVDKITRSILQFTKDSYMKLKQIASKEKIQKIKSKKSNFKKRNDNIVANFSSDSLKMGSFNSYYDKTLKDSFDKIISFSNLYKTLTNIIIFFYLSSDKLIEIDNKKILASLYDEKQMYTFISEVPKEKKKTCYDILRLIINTMGNYVSIVNSSPFNIVEQFKISHYNIQSLRDFNILTELQKVVQDQFNNLPWLYDNSEILSMKLFSIFKKNVKEKNLQLVDVFETSNNNILNLRYFVIENSFLIDKHFSIHKKLFTVHSYLFQYLPKIFEKYLEVIIKRLLIISVYYLITMHNITNEKNNDDFQNLIINSFIDIKIPENDDIKDFLTFIDFKKDDKKYESYHYIGNDDNIHLCISAHLWYYFVYNFGILDINGTINCNINDNNKSHDKNDKRSSNNSVLNNNEGNEINNDRSNVESNKNKDNNENSNKNDKSSNNDVSKEKLLIFNIKLHDNKKLNLIHIFILLQSIVLDTSTLNFPNITKPISIVEYLMNTLINKYFSEESKIYKDTLKHEILKISSTYFTNEENTLKNNLYKNLLNNDLQSIVFKNVISQQKITVQNEIFSLDNQLIDTLFHSKYFKFKFLFSDYNRAIFYVPQDQDLIFKSSKNKIFKHLNDTEEMNYSIGILIESYVIYNIVNNFSLPNNLLKKKIENFYKYYVPKLILLNFNAINFIKKNNNDQTLKLLNNRFKSDKSNDEMKFIVGNYYQYATILFQTNKILTSLLDSSFNENVSIKHAIDDFIEIVNNNKGQHFYNTIIEILKDIHSEYPCEEKELDEFIKPSELIDYFKFIDISRFKLTNITLKELNFADSSIKITIESKKNTKKNTEVNDSSADNNNSENIKAYGTNCSENSSYPSNNNVVDNSINNPTNNNKKYCLHIITETEESNGEIQLKIKNFDYDPEIFLKYLEIKDLYDTTNSYYTFATTYIRDITIYEHNKSKIFTVRITLSNYKLIYLYLSSPDLIVNNNIYYYNKVQISTQIHQLCNKNKGGNLIRSKRTRRNTMYKKLI